MLLFTKKADDKAVFEICHQVPGRMRLRLPALLKNPGLEQSVVAALRSGEGISAVRANLTCASLVVHYHGPVAPTRAALLSVLQPIVLPGTASSAGARLAQSKPAKPQRAVAKSRPARPALKPAGRRLGDCHLCRLKLSAARWIMTDVWRCWRTQWTQRLASTLAMLRP